jgi:hypothetical protein
MGAVLNEEVWYLIPDAHLYNISYKDISERIPRFLKYLKKTGVPVEIDQSEKVIEYPGRRSFLPIGLDVGGIEVVQCIIRGGKDGERFEIDIKPQENSAPGCSIVYENEDFEKAAQGVLLIQRVKGCLELIVDDFIEDTDKNYVRRFDKRDFLEKGIR